jgi:hypothetical protein
MRKSLALTLALGAGMGVLARGMTPELRRYLKMRKM